VFIAIGKTPRAYGPWQGMRVTLENPAGLVPTFPFDNGPLEAFTPGGFGSLAPPGVESSTPGIAGGEGKY
jgi:hypothetical protein